MCVSDTIVYNVDSIYINYSNYIIVYTRMGQITVCTRYIVPGIQLPGKLDKQIFFLSLYKFLFTIFGV